MVLSFAHYIFLFCGAVLLIQIKALLHSRPLILLDYDPHDSLVLRPAHFLIGEPTHLLTEPDLTDEKIPPLESWKLITKMTQKFWQTWSREYLQ